MHLAKPKGLKVKKQFSVDYTGEMYDSQPKTKMPNILSTSRQGIIKNHHSIDLFPSSSNLYDLSLNKSRRSNHILATNKNMKTKMRSPKPQLACHIIKSVINEYNDSGAGARAISVTDLNQNGRLAISSSYQSRSNLLSGEYQAND